VLFRSRKRVNVGLELAACPTLLFLDEPTSGLDATGSLLLVRVLQKMTQLGMTIVMVIHQPRYSLFTLIDDVLLLGKGGRTAFFGPTEQAKLYFERLGFSMPPNENPADWMMDVMSGQAENENPNISAEEMPERLFKEWEKFKEGGYLCQPSYSSRDLINDTLTNRDSSQMEEIEVIKEHIKDNWKRVDLPVTTALGVEDFTKVLLNCTGVEPSKQVVEEIMRRIEEMHVGRRGQRKGEESLVSHPEFEGYLLEIHKGTYLGAYSSDDLFHAEPDEEDADVTDSCRGSDTGSDEPSLGSGSGGPLGTSVGSRDGERNVRKPRTELSRRLMGRDGLGRELPGFLPQLMIFLQRRSIQWWRMQTMRLMFLVVVEFAAIFLACFDNFIFESPPWMPSNYMNCLISLALLTSVYSLRTFGSPEELPIFWRECSHGSNRLAFFVSRTLLDLLDMFLMCFGFASAYYIVMVPEMPFSLYIVPFIFVCYVSCSWGYFISCWLPFEFNSLGPFVSALLSFVFGGILGLPNEMSVYLSSPIFEIPINLLSFTRWGVPMIFFAYIEVSPVDPALMSVYQEYIYNSTITDYRKGWHLDGDENYWWTGMLFLSCLGMALRALAFLGLCICNKSKQV